MLTPLLVLLGILAGPAPASAVTLSVPERQVVERVSFYVPSSSPDETLTAAVYLDGRVVRRVAVPPGGRVRLTSAPLPFGWHSLRASLATAGAEPTWTPTVWVKAWGRPAVPQLLGPDRNWVGRQQPLSAKVGRATTRVRLVIRGTTVRTVSVSRAGTVRLGTYGFGVSRSNVRLVAENPAASTAVSVVLRRLDYPWPNCIVIDKSDYRLYWVRNGTLVKSYPIAHGRYNWTPVAIWRIDAKYRTDPRGVYGPRKMRLFRRAGGGYVFTAYGIHGTNQPWVIGTQASHGCIRMYNRDILELWPQVPLGTMVQTRE